MLRNIVELNAGRSFVLITNRFRSVQAQPQLASNAFDDTVDPEWADALPFEKIPRPSAFQLLRRFAPGGRYHNLSLPDLHQRFREEYGDLLVMPGILGRRDIVMTFKPDDFQNVFRTEGLWPSRRGLDTFTYYRKNYRPDVFNGLAGLVTEQGKSWHDFRTTVNSVMLQPKTIRLYVNKLDTIAKEFMNIIPKIRDHKNELPKNFNDWLSRWALETLGVLALDSRLGVLQHNLSTDGANIIQCVRDFFQLTYQLEVEPSIWKYYKTPKFHRLMKVFDELTNLVMSRVDEAMQRMEKSPSQTSDSQSVLEKLVKVDRNVAIVMAYDMILAGVDSTTSASAAILYCLAKNPDKQARLREELRTILPTKNSPLTPENMRNLPYLRACIKEGMRLFPATSGNFRATGKDLVLQGYRVPKGTDVAMGAMILHHKDEHFARGNEFMPERWLREGGCPSGRDVHPFLFLPFGFGARACIGKRMALLELELLVARITRQFEIRWNYEDFKIISSLINIPVNKLQYEMVDTVD